MIRDEEISRLIKYAEGLGVKVKFLKASRNCDEDAGWVIDGSEIVLYTNNRTSKIDIILSLIHELGHHTWFIHEKNRKPDLKFEEAIDRINLADRDLSKTPAPKKFRKKILDVEIAGTSWWENIYKETNMKFAKWKLDVAMQYDIWVYDVYYETGFFPLMKDRKIKRKQMVREFKK